MTCLCRIVLDRVRRCGRSFRQQRSGPFSFSSRGSVSIPSVGGRRRRQSSSGTRRDCRSPVWTAHRSRRGRGLPRLPLGIRPASAVALWDTVGYFLLSTRYTPSGTVSAHFQADDPRGLPRSNRRSSSSPSAGGGAERNRRRLEIRDRGTISVLPRWGCSSSDNFGLFSSCRIFRSSIHFTPL